MYSLSSNVNSFWGETMSGGENFQYAMLSYRVKQVTLGLFAINPFMDNWKQETENWNRFASYHRTSHIKESSNVVGLSLSYNFSFGRSFKSAQKRVNNSDSDSGVSNAGKWEILLTFADMKKESKEAILFEIGKFLIDIAKLVFGGVILAGIMKYENINQWLLIRCWCYQLCYLFSFPSLHKKEFFQQ